jgi:hypothetical protein
MADYWITYKDIEDIEPRQSFEMMGVPKPGEQVVRSGMLPGKAGLKDLYVRWLHRGVGADTVHLLTYTHVALKARESKDLVIQALRFAQRRN